MLFKGLENCTQVKSNNKKSWSKLHLEQGLPQNSPEEPPFIYCKKNLCRCSRVTLSGIPRGGIQIKLGDLMMAWEVSKNVDPASFQNTFKWNCSIRERLGPGASGGAFLVPFVFAWSDPSQRTMVARGREMTPIQGLWWHYFWRKATCFLQQFFYFFINLFPKFFGWTNSVQTLWKLVKLVFNECII